MSDIVCGVQYHRCLCGEAPGHEPPHVCCRPSAATPDGKCLGKWQADPDSDDGVKIIEYPMGGTTTRDALERAGVNLDVDAVLDIMPRQVRRGGIRFTYRS